MDIEKYRANAFRPDRLTILFVDDEMSIVESLTQLFDNDYNIYALTNPLDVLKLMEHDRNVAILVSDQRMPEMRGVDLLKQVSVTSPSTLRILLTGYADLEAVLDSVNVGEVYRYLRKPWKPETIRATIGLAASTYLLRTQKKAPFSPPVELKPLHIPTTNDSVQTRLASFEEEFFATFHAQQESLSSLPSLNIAHHTDDVERLILGRSGKPKILLIDDEEQVVTSISDLLSQEFDVIGCKSPATALDIIHANPFIAVVISDQRMPQMSGVDFLIEAQRIAPEIPKILLTGQIDAEDVIRLVNEGQVYRYLSKPWNVAKLKETLHSAVEICKAKLREKDFREMRQNISTAPTDAKQSEQPKVQMQNLKELAALFQKKT